MAKRKVLVPFNFTSVEEKTLAFVIDTYAHCEDVIITLFHVYPRMPTIDLATQPELRKLQDAMDSVADEINEKKAELNAAAAFLVENGFAQEQIECVICERKKAIPDDIINSAMKGRYHVLALSRQPGKITGLFTRSVHTKILSALKNVVVCIVS